jgi:DDE superfamily endonuclease
LAVDVTTWPRCDAECSPQRGYYHPSRHSAGQPIIAGWAYQWICQLGFDRDSWTAPVDAARLHPAGDTDQQAACQVDALLARLPAGGPVPLVVFDAGYGSAQLSPGPGRRAGGGGFSTQLEPAGATSGQRRSTPYIG